MEIKKDNSIAQHFGENLALILAQKIIKIYPEFEAKKYIKKIKKEVEGVAYSGRILVHAQNLKLFLPSQYSSAIKILTNILGGENPNETGMFKEYYWIMPIGKYVELYGIENFEISIQILEEITKRNTAEFAIRPFINKYPNETLNLIKKWSKSKNFHLRRLASEGLRPKLPWASKLNLFIENPYPIFEILEILKEDNITFVKKSVANHLTDYLKVNYEKTAPLIQEWKKSNNPHTQWIIKRATRKIIV